MAKFNKEYGRRVAELLGFKLVTAVGEVIVSVLDDIKDTLKEHHTKGRTIRVVNITPDDGNVPEDDIDG